MRVIIGAWVIFTVGLLAMLVSCPRSHAQTHIGLLPSAGTLIMHRGHHIAAFVEPYPEVCVGECPRGKPWSAACKPAIEWHEWAIYKIFPWF